MREKVLETMKMLGFVLTPVLNYHLFRFEGKGYLLYLDDDDDQFLSIVIPNLMDAESDDEEEHDDMFMEMLRVEAEVNAKIKYVKALIQDESLWLSYEREVVDEEDFEDLLPKMIFHLFKASEFVRNQVLKAQLAEDCSSKDYESSEECLVSDCSDDEFDELNGSYDAEIIGGLEQNRNK